MVGVSAMVKMKRMSPARHCLTLGVLLQTVLFKSIVSGSNPKYVGCFKDTENVRDLDDHLEVLITTNTPQACQDLCKHRGFPYAGVQHGTQCHCGDIYGQYGQVADNECNEACSGDGDMFCGADKKNAVYKTGLETLSWQELVMTNSHGEKIVNLDVGDHARVKVIWARTEHGKIVLAKKGNWQAVDGVAASVTIGNAGVFYSDSTDQRVRKRINISSSVPEGVDWSDQLPSVIAQFIISGPERLYIVSNTGHLHFYDDETGSWQDINAGATESGVLAVSLSRTMFWLTKSHEIVHISVANNNFGARGSFPNDAGIIKVATDDQGMVVALDGNGTLYLRDGTNARNHVGTHWVPIDRKHKFKDIDIELLDIYAVDDDGKLWKGKLENDESYVGCYQDSGDRALPVRAALSHSLSNQMCRELCALRNYVYAATQSHRECFCGNVYSDSHKVVAAWQCFWNCYGNFNQKCGGFWKNSLHETVVDTSPSQSIAVNEAVKLSCKTNAPLDVSVAWTRDGVLIQNRTEDTELIVSSAENGTFVYQCSLHHGKFLQIKNVTITVEDAVTACARSKSLNDPSRSSSNCGIKNKQAHQTMESLQADQWYEFYGIGGTLIPTSCVKENSCGGRMSGWLNGEHPDVADGVVARQLCFSYSGDCCYHSVDINVRQCFGNYIYKFPKIPEYFQGRVCTEKEPLGTGPSSQVSNPIFYMAGEQTKNMALVGHILTTLEASSSAACNLFCWLKSNCKSYNYNHSTKTCELNTKKASNDFGNLTPIPGFTYYHPAGNTVKVIP